MGHMHALAPDLFVCGISLEKLTVVEIENFLFYRPKHRLLIHVRTTSALCFETKRRSVYPCIYTLDLLYKSGMERGIRFMMKHVSAALKIGVLLLKPAPAQI